MKQFQIKKLTGLIIACILGAVTTGFAGDGGGRVKAGYIYIDEEGNRAVNQETYNSYEGIGLSFEDWRYRLNNGVTLKADLHNVTLNNRNLRASASKPGLFNISLRNSQYRRSYDFDGGRFTRRRTTGGQVSMQPHRNAKLFGGFTQTDKHGVSSMSTTTVSDSVFSSTDYSHSSYNLGGLVTFPYGSARIEYRRYDFDDKVKDSGDRKANSIRVDASTLVPGANWINLSGGYHHRVDELDATELELKTNQGWGGVKLYLPRGHLLDYRILFARTQHSGDDSETDNVINTIAVGKSIGRIAGVRIGYENRISDDLVDRTVSHGFLFRGWCNYQQRLFLKVSLATRKKEVKTGATLLGDENFTRHRLTARYRDDRWGDFTAQWQGRIRENQDLRSKVDYNTISLDGNLTRSEYGRLSLRYSYYVGKYENASDEIDYQFSDHLVAATLYPKAYRDVTVHVGGTYYRSRRGRDAEKFSLNFGAVYRFLDDHELEIKYQVFNFDDFLTRGSYYTANIVEISVTKAISLD